jgi:hypothetical protein
LPASAIFTFGTAFIFGRLPGVEVCWHRGKHNTSLQIANHGQTDSGSPVVFFVPGSMNEKRPTGVTGRPLAFQQVNILIDSKGAEP